MLKNIQLTGAHYCAALALVLTLALFLACGNVRTDDAYIFYTYAKNLAQGQGYVFNPGEHVNGTTSALYPLVTALIYAPLQVFSAISAPKVGYSLGIAALFLTQVFLCSLLCKENLKLTAFFFVALLIGNSSLYAGIGMETYLLLALLSASLYLYQKTYLLRCGLMLALATLTRPDAILFALALLVYHFIKTRKLPGIKVFIVFVLVLLPWFIFSHLYFGSILPETFGAKLAQTDTQRWGEGFLFLKGAYKVLGKSYGSYTWVVIGASFLLCLGMWRKFHASCVMPVFTLWAVLYFLTYAFALNPPAYNWYYTPLSIPVALWLAAGLEILVVRYTVLRAARVAFLATLILSLRPAVLLWDGYHRPVTTKYALYKRAATWLNQNASPGATLASNEVGVLGYYYTQGKIIDPLGLITQGALEHIRQRNFAWYLNVHRPTFLVLNNPPRPILEDFTKESWFNALYKLRKTVSLPYQRGGVLIFERISA